MTSKLLIILQNFVKFRNCISRKQAVFAFLDFVYPWFIDQINCVNYVKYFSWFCASLLSLTSGKNGHSFSSFWELTSSRTKMTLLKSLKTSSLGANYKCLSLLTWPQKVLPLTHTYQLNPLHWDHFLVNKALIAKMGLFDPDQLAQQF